MVEDFRPERQGRDLLDALLDEVPQQVEAALRGDVEALVRLVLIAGEAGRQGRAENIGSLADLAARTQALADGVAHCYSEAAPPAPELCDEAFALAGRVEALVAELAALRAAGGLEGRELPAEGPGLVEVRHLARAHLAALRDAAADGLVVGPADVEAAAGLYEAVVTAGRRAAEWTARQSLSEHPPQ